jgi:hypothetical protein
MPRSVAISTDIHVVGGVLADRHRPVREVGEAEEEVVEVGFGCG